MTFDIHLALLFSFITHTYNFSITRLLTCRICYECTQCALNYTTVLSVLHQTILGSLSTNKLIAHKIKSTK